MGNGALSLYGQRSYNEDEWLALSGLQHFAFCKRQWALIHIEQQWVDNYLTTAGSLEHERAHDYAQSESRGDLLILRGLRVFSRSLGLTGACDVVEFHKNDEGVPLRGQSGRWLPYPVEYKHGSSKLANEDRVQLCAEAICLEEMLSCTIPQGALFYQKTRRREIVDLSDSLREQVIAMSAQMHELYERGHTPRARRSKACTACSLKDVCLPELTKTRSGSEYINTMLAELQSGNMEGMQ